MPNTYKQIFHVIAQRSHGRFTVSYTTFYPIISRIKVNTRNKAPIHFVARASLASIVLALFFAKKESATPPIATGWEKNDQNNAQATQHLQNGKKELHNGKPPYIYAYANIYKLF